jgi:putative membrane protein
MRAAPPSPVEAGALFPALPVTLEPDVSLLRYYTLSSLLLGPFFFVLLLPRYFRYRTLRYEVDAEGITMRWGILFRREISLTYSRIQDIHLSSNVLERWLGLAKIQVQTASGSSGAEMTIEGLHAFAEMRDFLYSRMRGARDHFQGPRTGARPVTASTAPGELAGVLHEIAAEVRAIRNALSGTTDGPPAASSRNDDA